LLDMGILSQPSVPSGRPDGSYVRLHALMASHAIMPSAQLQIGGAFFQRVDGPHGVLPRKWGGVDFGSNSGYTFSTQARDRTVLQSYWFSDILDPELDGQNIRGEYRGVFPMIGASIGRIDIAMGARLTATYGIGSHLATSYPAHVAPFATRVLVRYQPRFSFLKGI
jgi:hypothetical protein